jgi:hypothetical protein
MIGGNHPSGLHEVRAVRESSPRAGPGYALARRCVGLASKSGSAFAPVIVEEASLRRGADCADPVAPGAGQNIKPSVTRPRVPVPKRFSIQNFALQGVGSNFGQQLTNGDIRKSFAGRGIRIGRE